MTKVTDSEAIVKHTHNYANLISVSEQPITIFKIGRLSIKCGYRVSTYDLMCGCGEVKRIDL